MSTPLRVALAVAALAAAIALAHYTGLRQRLSLGELRALMAAAGLWGALLLVAAFTAGLLAYVPGTVFVAAGVLSYGRLWGGALGWVGSVIAVSASFVVVRTLGGRALGGIDRPLVQRLLARLEQRPIRTVVLMRVVFWMSPIVNYALALSRIRFRDYLLGSACGLAGPVLTIALLVDRIAAYLMSP